jgi:metal-dependent amidase/aminoacylase/carboxypeptidase family protein
LQIHCIKISGEAVSSDIEATRAFTVEFMKIIEDNEEFYDLTQQLTEQQKEDEDEKERWTNEMQTKDITDILSAIDTAVEKLCDIDPDWERSSTVKRGIRAVLQFY